MSIELRDLCFDDLQAAVTEAYSLLETGYERRGNWSLGMVCQHLRLVQDPSIDGYPLWMSLFAPIRPIVRRVLLPKILQGNSPVGIRTSGIFAPQDQVSDEREVHAFSKSVDRFCRHQGDFHAHPGFGKLERSMLETVHSAHAAHHLRFLIARVP